MINDISVLRKVALQRKNIQELTDIFKLELGKRISLGNWSFLNLDRSIASHTRKDTPKFPAGTANEDSVFHSK